MNITYRKAGIEDIDPVYELSRNLILDYENLESIDVIKVLEWVRRKIESSIDEYQVIYTDNRKTGYVHFSHNNDMYEIDDLYIFAEYRNKGIGTSVIKDFIASKQEPVMLYVFINNTKAVSLYKRLGFEIRDTVHNSRYIMVYDHHKRSDTHNIQS